MDMTVQELLYQVVNPKQKFCVASFKKGVIDEDLDLQDVSEYGDKLLQGIEVFGYDAKLTIWIE